jgi:hypothetical protein
MRSGSITFAGAAGLAAALLTSLPANAGLLTLVVLDNGALVGSDNSSTGQLTFTTSDSNFSDINVTVTGVPLLPVPDLGTVSTDISTSAGFTGTHVLTILAKQSELGSIAINPGTVTFTANGLIGAPGPTTESFLLNGTSVASHVFPAAAGSANASAPTPGGLLSSETEAIAATFTADSQDQEATVEFRSTVIPEPSTWAMMMLGFAAIAFAAYRKARRGAAFAT